MRGRGRLAPLLFPVRDVERAVDAVERALTGPHNEVIVGPRAWRQVLGDRPPLAAGRNTYISPFSTSRRFARHLSPPAPPVHIHRLTEEPPSEPTSTRRCSKRQRPNRSREPLTNAVACSGNWNHHYLRGTLKPGKKTPHDREPGPEIVSGESWANLIQSSSQELYVLAISKFKTLSSTETADHIVISISN